jgi:hypothetical protein
MPCYVIITLLRRLIRDSTIKYIPASSVGRHQQRPISDAGIAGIVIAAGVVAAALVLAAASYGVYASVT